MKKIRLLFLVVALCMLAACGKESTKQNTEVSSKVVLTQTDKDLQARIDTLKSKEAFAPRIYYLSDDKMVIVDTAGMVNYDLKQGKIVDVLLGEENGFTGAFYIQGDDSDMIVTDGKGEKLYFLPDMESKKVAPYYYDLVTKELVEMTKEEAKKIKDDSEIQSNHSAALSGKWELGDAKYSFKQSYDEGAKCSQWDLKCTKKDKTETIDIWR